MLRETKRTRWSWIGRICHGKKDHVFCIRWKLFFPLLSTLQLSRDKHTLEDKLQDMQQALDSEENKCKQEHRQRLKLESNIQDLDEKLDRESKVCGWRVKH